MYVFKGEPTFSDTPCPGGLALVGGSCPEFKCNDQDVPCLNSGTCEADGKCKCDTGFKGLDCALFECTDTSQCNNVGTCDSSTKKCTCDPGFSGVNCKTCTDATRMINGADCQCKSGFMEDPSKPSPGPTDACVAGRKTLTADEANPQVLKDLSEITHF